MTIKELRIELIKQDKTVTWLANKMGCSNAWIYQIISLQRENEIEQIKKILEEGKE